jgi:hypothetical protein
MRKVLCLLTFFFANFAQYEYLFAYEVKTHRKITEIAFLKSTLGTGYLTNIGISPSDILSNNMNAQDWMIEGSIREDESISSDTGGEWFRYQHHFFDPVNNKGLDYYLPILGIGSYHITGYKAPDWALEDIGTYSGQFYSIQDAKQYYFNGLTATAKADRNKNLAKTFRALGQVMHMVQDMAQPQHTRNDAHGGDMFGTPYGLQIFGTKSQYEMQIDSEISRRTFSPDYTPIFNSYRKFYVTGDGKGLAEFSNRSFVTAGTNFNCIGYDYSSGFCASSGGYPSPSLDITRKEEVPIADLLTELNMTDSPLMNETGVVTFFGNLITDNYSGGTIENNRITTYSIFDKDLQARGLAPAFTLNKANYNKMAEYLLPRAVGYSAGLLNYFFRGKVNMEKDPQNAGKYIIKNESSEKMEGTFALYYDDASGNRNAVPGASWTLMINANSQSVPVTFTEPTSPAPKEKGKYILVFNGKLGMEEGAVVGREVTLLLCDATTPISLLGPEIVPKNGTVQFKASSGCSPYTWTVTGAGVTISQDGTVTLTNSCGSIKVTVKDSNGKTASYTSRAPGRWMNTSATIYGNCCDCIHKFYYPTLYIGYGQSGPCSDSYMEGNTVGDWYFCMLYSGGFSCYEEFGDQRNVWEFMTTCASGNVWGYPDCANKTIADYCAEYNSSSDFGSSSCYPRTQFPSVPPSCIRSMPHTQGDVVAALLMVQEWRCQ